MMLKKMIVILGILFFVSAALVTNSSGADYKWPSFVRIATPGVGTANHSIASAWTAEFSASTKVRARVLPAPHGYSRGEWFNVI